MKKTAAVYMLIPMLGLSAALAAEDRADADQKKTDDRIAKLEERIRELEARLEKKEMSSRERRWRMDEGDDWEFRSPRWSDLREHMDRLRRQQRDLFEKFWWDEMDRIGPDFDAPFFGREKPRLGIGMAPVSDELKTKYGNDVSSGVFVVEVYAKSPAEAAGIREGDCIVAFAGKTISSPEDLAEAVRNAPAGQVDVKIVRKGREIVAKVDLPKKKSSFWGGLSEWMRGFRGPDGERFEFQVDSDSLRLSDELAEKMKLTAEQRKRVEDVLEKARNELNEEIRKEWMPRRGPSRSWRFEIGDDVEDRIKAKEAEIEKALSAFLSPEQMEVYRKERASRRSTSVRRMFILRHGSDAAEDPWLRPEKQEKGMQAETGKRERF